MKEVGRYRSLHKKGEDAMCIVIMHGRNGNIKQKPQAQSTKLRWLQRVCVEIDYK